MSTTSKSSSPRGKKLKKEAPAFTLPILPSLLTRPLGLEGWIQAEPVLLAALITEEPMLLIGPHGSAKSFLLERLAQVLGLEYRFYNASLINYDDLVGIPLPDEERKKLRYISTASAIWDAEIVFVDEINRTRPELQNKLFPIIHERRVQGIPLEKLHYRWAAMNPPPSIEAVDEDVDIYFGAEPLDPALADRFCYIVEVPSWQKLSDEQKRAVLRDQFAGEHPFPISPHDLIRLAGEWNDQLQANPPQAIEDYVVYILSLLEGQKIVCSARRATMFHRNILAVHAARMALYQQAYPQLPCQVIDWNTSALVALQHSLPQIAQGRKIDPVSLLAAHRQAWEITHIDAENPWRELLLIDDPLQRCIAAIKMGSRVNDDDLSQLVLDAAGSQQLEEFRLASLLVIFLAVRETRNLRATVYETLAQQLHPVLQPTRDRVYPGDTTMQSRCRAAHDMANQLRSSTEPSLKNAYAANLLMGLASKEAYKNATAREVRDFFIKTWNQLIPVSA